MSLLTNKSSTQRSTQTQRVLCDSEAPCSFSGYRCSIGRVEGFEYCFRHILEDKSAPVQQCRYVFPNSKRCFRSAMFGSRRESFCPEHSRQSWRKRQRSSLKLKPPNAPETCLKKLSHYEKLSTSSPSEAMLDPAAVPSVASKAKMYDIPDEDFSALSHLDVRLLPRAEEDSEFDSMDSDSDFLDGAGVFTTEEACRIYMEKLQKLKNLYQGEYKRLFHSLKEARREYLREVRKEKETMGNIHSQPKTTPEDKEAYEELKQLVRFHGHFGREALLYKQSCEKRLQATEGTTPKAPTPFNKCIYNEGSWKCGLKSVPLSKFCFKHILQDERQVLFKPCGSMLPGGEECTIPVIPLPPNDPACIYHTSFPKNSPLKEGVRSSAEDGFSISNQLKPNIVDFTDSNSIVISEVPPDNVMEGDAEGRLEDDIVKAGVQDTQMEVTEEGLDNTKVGGTVNTKEEGVEGVVTLTDEVNITDDAEIDTSMGDIKELTKDSLEQMVGDLNDKVLEMEIDKLEGEDVEQEGETGSKEVETQKMDSEEKLVTNVEPRDSENIQTSSIDHLT